MKVYKKKIKSDAIDTVEFGELNLDWHRDDHGLVITPRPLPLSVKQAGMEESNSDPDAEEKKVFQLLKLKREELQEWHIEEHKKRVAARHPEVTGAVTKSESALDFLFKEPTEADIISQCMLHGVPVPTEFPPPEAFYAKIGLPVPISLGAVREEEGEVDALDDWRGVRARAAVSIELDSCSSLDDIMSVGSLVDSGKM